MNGFILGFANGTSCLIYCVPVLIPFLVGEGKTTLKNYIYLGEFLLGRLTGYILFAIAAWFAGRFLVTITDYREVIYGSAYIILAGFLIIYSLVKTKKHACSANYFRSFLNKIQKSESAYLPLITGFLLGLNLCPPFLIMFVEAADANSLFESIFSFFTFFLGTTIWIIPLPFVGFLSKIKKMGWLKPAGKIAAVLVGLFYLYSGSTAIIEYYNII
jgi:sulfite exporter TauE/SafE